MIRLACSRKRRTLFRLGGAGHGGCHNESCVAVVSELGCWAQVTPSSKVVGDLAQFMVQNELTEETLVERADTLALPNRSAGCWHMPSVLHVSVAL